ncbi:MAG: hypothetical protein KC416_08735 [Myxococcales bacterium]|nr:hypothetical protein [Myxococcales bacterium]
MNPLAITGYGLVSPIGVGREALGRALLSPGPAEGTFGPSSVLDRQAVGDVRVAECRDFEAKTYLGDKGIRNFDRFTRFLVVAAKHALEDAGIKRDGEHVVYSSRRVGIASATAYGSLEAITELNLIAQLEDPRYINPAKFPNTVINAAAGYVSIWEDLRAPNITIVDGNCGSLDAVLTCQTHLDHKRGDAFLLGGGEVLSDALMLAFQKLGLTAADSDEGITLGEGAAYVVVERASDARSRSAKIVGYIVGYGTSFLPPPSDALLVHASPEPIRAAIEGALQDAGLGPGDIDLVCSAYSGAASQDEAEREALEAIFGPDVAVTAPKDLFGETFGAAGALSLVCAMPWMAGEAQPSLRQGRLPDRIRSVLITAVGYYGNVSAVVVRSPSAL